MSESDIDTEFDRAMVYTRIALKAAKALAAVLPGGKNALAQKLAGIYADTERKYREIVFRDKLDAAARERGERLLAKLRAELEALAKEHGT